MKTSEQVNEIATALASAQGAMKGAVKDAENPHFRSKYADLASVWDACRGPLTSNGISVIQSPRLVSNGEGWLVEVETTLLHKSGQFFSDALQVPVTKADAQGVGSALTYARRYALSAFVGVAPEDDDGNAASAPAKPLDAAETARRAALRVLYERMTVLHEKHPDVLVHAMNDMSSDAQASRRMLCEQYLGEDVRAVGELTAAQAKSIVTQIVKLYPDVK